MSPAGGPPLGAPGDGPFQPLAGGPFRFACHPDVPCFNECCADLNLVLTPYDVLRLKNRLGMTSDSFLDEYTAARPPEGGRFPMIMLRMTDRPGRPCPFVTPQGCSVYEDRPGACRTYPLGRGSASGGREAFFLVKEAHCRGFEAGRDWTVQDWLADQGLTEYNLFNDLWMEVITSKASLGPDEHRGRKIQMFFMVSYNLDRFRDFVFQSPFLARFDVPAETVEAARRDDAALLRLGLDWLAFALYGKKTIAVRQPA